MNNKNSNWKKLLGFRNMQEKLEKSGLMNESSILKMLWNIVQVFFYKIMLQKYVCNMYETIFQNYIEKETAAKKISIILLVCHLNFKKFQSPSFHGGLLNKLSWCHNLRFSLRWNNFSIFFVIARIGLWLSSGYWLETKKIGSLITSLF